MKVSHNSQRNFSHDLSLVKKFEKNTSTMAIYYKSIKHIFYQNDLYLKRACLVEDLLCSTDKLFLSQGYSGSLN